MSLSTRQSNTAPPASKAVFAFMLLASMTLSLWVASPVVHAQSKARSVQSQGISSGQAANIARRSAGGKVLSVRAGGSHFRVKILKSNGVVTNVKVNKASGQVSR